MKRVTKPSIGLKLYVFIILTVLGVAVGTAILAHQIGIGQIDRYYKQVTFDTAVNFASFVDGDYLAKLRTAAESDEYQALRKVAEEAEDESMVQGYLESHGLWNDYQKTRNDLAKYLNNMHAIRYLYIIAAGDQNALYDMYLIDDYNNPLYVLGYYEKREDELLGIDATQAIEPTISSGEWGWLCSAYAPVYDSSGRIVCQIGCDFGMDDIVAERARSLRNVLFAVAVLTALVLVVAVIFVNRVVIKPLDSLTNEMKKFDPAKSASYAEAGVMDLDIRSHDEIRELHDGIRTMQIKIIDYLNNLLALQKDKERAEADIKMRDERIGRISAEAYHDALTGVGSKTAYDKRVDELERVLSASDIELGLVMVDMNNLKTINDEYGHKSGDLYIQGCCHLACEVFKHSPVFRVGGDEFVVILQGADYEHRHELVDALQRTYAACSEDMQADPWLRYSAAVGMSELVAGDRTLESVFKRADKAMYEDKHQFKATHYVRSGKRG